MALEPRAQERLDYYNAERMGLLRDRRGDGSGRVTIMLDQLLEELTDAAKQLRADPRNIEVLVVGEEPDPNGGAASEIDLTIRCVRAHGLVIRIEPNEPPEEED